MDTPSATNIPRPHLAVATIVGILSAVIAVGAYLVAANYGNFWPYASEEEIFCTQEAKICPDGSGVGRTGPNCEFAPCPGVPPAGCYYHQVQCIRAPCYPELICP